MNPISVTQVLGGKRYSTDTAIRIASDEYWDGSNWERHGHNTFLFRTKNGSYFKHCRTQWIGEPDGTIEPLEEYEAIALYESLREQEVPFESAFPNSAVEEA